MNQDKVALFSTNFLPYSQTFIYDEIAQHQRYQVEVFARTRQCADRFPFDRIHIAAPWTVLTRWDGAFYRKISAGDYSLIHAHFGTGAVYAEPYARRCSLPLVISFHGHDVTRLYSLERYLPKTWRYSLLRNRLFGQMTLGLCASSELKELLMEMGVAEAKLRVHRLGVDLASYQSSEKPSGRFEVVMIGRFVAKKGFAFGIRAFARLAEANQQATLTIVGSGAGEAGLRLLVSQLGLERRVVFTGALQPQAIRELLSRSHVLLAPSVIDAVGDRESGLIVVKEASACNAVPIGTYHGGIPDIIDDGQTGYLVCERDVQSMADRLCRLAADPKLCSALGSAARQKMIDEYDNRKCVARLEDYYDEARMLHRK